MKIIDGYGKFITAVNKVMDALLTIDVIAMLLILLLQIVSRFVVFFIIDWAQDLIVFLLVCSVYLGCGSATFKGKQIRLEFLVDMFPKKITNIILCFADIIAIVYLVIITKDAFSLMAANLTLKIGVSLVAVGYYYLAVAIGFIAMALNLVYLILKRIPVIIGKEAA